MILGEAVSPAAIDGHLYRMGTNSRTTRLPRATSELRAHRATLELVSGGSPDWLYVLDGNHRLIAQWLAHRDLGGVDGYLVIEPRLKEWAYVPTAHKSAWQPQVG